MTKLSHLSTAERIDGEKAHLQQIGDTNAGLPNSKPTFDIETIARESLRTLSVPKEWSGSLHVTPQQVNAWKNGERIPEARQHQIVQQAMIYFLSLDGLRNKVSRLFLDDVTRRSGEAGSVYRRHKIG